MWQSYIFGMHWKHGGKVYYDEITAGSQEEAAGYFIDHCRDDVTLVRVELVGPDDGGTREYAHSPVSRRNHRPRMRPLFAEGTHCRPSVGDHHRHLRSVAL